jgi:hypothetical protein
MLFYCMHDGAGSACAVAVPDLACSKAGVWPCGTYARCWILSGVFLAYGGYPYANVRPVRIGTNPGNNSCSVTRGEHHEVADLGFLTLA